MWRALVVDDNSANRQLIVEVLAQKAVCEIAVNGREAKEKYHLSLQNNTPYDLILLDIAMPVIDGLEFLREARKDEHKRGIALGDGVPVIMVTAHKAMFMQALQDGCDDYILKPIDPGVLIQKIEKLLEGRKERR
ncbi:MAG: response regulator [Candidatus Omnitrophica bacterium]|nr:response regulator [Candidatus Omnitrophota bacterium]